MKILVVDDASFTRDLIKRTVRKRFSAVTVEEAVNGRKAQQLLEKMTFDMVLCDWEMPEMTGVELLQWCREQPQYNKETLPFVMITSRGDKSHVVEAVQSGVTDYLGKPFSADQLIAKMMSAAKRVGLDKKLNSMQSKAPSHSVGGVATASLDVLTGGATKIRTPNAKVTNPAPKEEAAVTQKEVKIPTKVRFAGKEFRCMVMQLSLTEVSMLIKSDDVIPTVLDQAVVDLMHEDTVNRLNYYVQAVATTEKKPDCAFLSVTLQLIDQDADKEAFLKRLFDSL